MVGLATTSALRQRDTFGKAVGICWKTLNMTTSPSSIAEEGSIGYFLSKQSHYSLIARHLRVGHRYAK